MLKEKILVVDDERNIIELLRYNLEKEGYKVVSAKDGDEALHLARQEKPDLIILDIMMPGRGGFEVCRILRQEKIKTPIIMVTSKGEEIDKILGLELGADDYVTKPFQPRELIARVKAVLRRTNGQNEEKTELNLGKGALIINLVRREVRVGGKIVELKPKEFDLLKLLAANPGEVFFRNNLLEQIWGYNYEGGTRTVDVHMRRLREKIEQDPSKPRYLITVHAVGYKFQSEK